VLHIDRRLELMRRHAVLAATMIDVTHDRREAMTVADGSPCCMPDVASRRDNRPISRTIRAISSLLAL
jgi:ABC-type sugar transport system ATPase subunit